MYWLGMHSVARNREVFFSYKKYECRCFLAWVRALKDFRAGIFAVLFAFPLWSQDGFTTPNITPTFITGKGGRGGTPRACIKTEAFLEAHRSLPYIIWVRIVSHGCVYLQRSWNLGGRAVMIVNQSWSIAWSWARYFPKQNWDCVAKD